MTLDAKVIRFVKSVLLGLGCAAVLCQPVSAAPGFASLPLYFEANQGQADTAAQFIARGQDSQFLISPGEARFDLFKTTGSDPISARTVRMQFVGASAQARISGAEELSGKINYLIGGDSSNWKTGVTTFAKVHVEEVYPGVSLTYYGNHKQLEYDFSIAPGANPGVIAIHFDGADNISISPAGELVLNLGDSEIRQPKPVIYEILQGGRREVTGGYKMLDAHTVGFDVGDHDRTQPLVIDPILSYSTYFGGSADDIAWKVAVDTNGFVYVAGETLSAKLATVGAVQTNYAGGTWTGDAFVAKFSNDGSNLVYCTYLGGSQDDFAYGLAVDNAGDVFLTGSTDSPDFPTNNALYPNIRGHSYTSPRTGTFYNSNAFVTELDRTGSHLVYSTYFGGSGDISLGSGDTGTGIAVDSEGNAYVTGLTSSTNFPVTNSLSFPTYRQLYGTNNIFGTNILSSTNFFPSPNFTYGTNFFFDLSDTNAYYTLDHLSGSENTFLAKIGPGGTNLIYSTYFFSSILTNSFIGPNGRNLLYPFFDFSDLAAGIAVDSAGSAYIAGTVENDVFVAKFAPSGTNMIYYAWIGGTNNDQAFGIAVDAAGNAYVTGGTTSPNFPNTMTNLPGLGNGLTNNISRGYLVTTNAFLAQIIWNGTNAALGYSAVFGGTNFGIDAGYGVAVDPQGNVFVCGASSSASFPVLNATDTFAATNSGGFDAFVIAFATNASSVLYSGYLGGSG